IAKLLDLGFTESEIDRMSPEEAQRLLRAGVKTPPGTEPDAVRRAAEPLAGRRPVERGTEKSGRQSRFTDREVRMDLEDHLSNMEGDRRENILELIEQTRRTAKHDLSAPEVYEQAERILSEMLAETEGPAGERAVSRLGELSGDDQEYLDKFRTHVQNQLAGMPEDNRLPWLRSIYEAGERRIREGLDQARGVSPERTRAQRAVIADEIERLGGKRPPEEGRPGETEEESIARITRSALGELGAREGEGRSVTQDIHGVMDDLLKEVHDPQQQLDLLHDLYTDVWGESQASKNPGDRERASEALRAIRERAQDIQDQHQVDQGMLRRLINTPARHEGPKARPKPGEALSDEGRRRANEIGESPRIQDLQDALKRARERGDEQFAKRIERELRDRGFEPTTEGPMPIAEGRPPGEFEQYQEREGKRRTVQDLIDRARAAMERGDHDEAERLLDEADKIHKPVAEDTQARLNRLREEERARGKQVYEERQAKKGKKKPPEGEGGGAPPTPPPTTPPEGGAPGEKKPLPPRLAAWKARRDAIARGEEVPEPPPPKKGGRQKLSAQTLIDRAKEAMAKGQHEKASKLLDEAERRGGAKPPEEAPAREPTADEQRIRELKARAHDTSLSDDERRQAFKDASKLILEMRERGVFTKEQAYKEQTDIRRDLEAEGLSLAGESKPLKEGEKILPRNVRTPEERAADEAAESMISAQSKTYEDAMRKWVEENAPAPEGETNEQRVNRLHDLMQTLDADPKVSQVDKDAARRFIENEVRGMRGRERSEKASGSKSIEPPETAEPRVPGEHEAMETPIRGKYKAPNRAYADLKNQFVRFVRAGGDSELGQVTGWDRHGLRIENEAGHQIRVRLDDITHVLKRDKPLHVGPGEQAATPEELARARGEKPPPTTEKPVGPESQQPKGTKAVLGKAARTLRTKEGQTMKEQLAALRR
ncbi:MAG TPA: hypothetical protein VE964_05575, partial [Myxococcales bacterium]|nr:hypothetical protein [Myxococcales bacterium]